MGKTTDFWKGSFVFYENQYAIYGRYIAGIRRVFL